LDQKAKKATATDRALWLAELAIAIEQAQRLTWRLGVSEGDSAEAKSLYARLESLRAEVDSLRRGSWSGKCQALDPFWMQLLPWRSGADALGEEAGEIAP
jgi:hypothetical protein